MKDERKHDDDVVLLRRAPNAAIAGFWASMLEEAGIPCSVPGTHLADEWAASQRVMGNLGADVLVPRSRLEEARRVIAAEEEAKPAAAVAPAPAPPSESVQLSTKERRAIGYEVLAACCVLVLPSLINRFLRLALGDSTDSGGDWAPTPALYMIALCIPKVVFVRWLIARSGEPLSAFGWVRFRVVLDLSIAFVLLAFILFIYRGVGRLIYASTYGPAVTILGSLSIGFTEELIFRGYLATRLRAALNSGVMAAVVSSALWALGHLYQGGVSTSLHFFAGLVYCAALFLTKRLWPLVIAHGAYNALIQLARSLG